MDLDFVCCFLEQIAEITGNQKLITLSDEFTKKLEIYGAMSAINMGRIFKGRLNEQKILESADMLDNIAAIEKQRLKSYEKLKSNNSCHFRLARTDK